MVMVVYCLSKSCIYSYLNFVLRTEFTDCLGRTRKCLKSDLELYKEKDRNLMGILIDGKAPESVRMVNEEEVIDKEL